MTNFVVCACIGFLFGVFIGCLAMCKEDKK